jgi:ubiquinone/menaquinone biosynthesis C-methylase UbiE
LNTFTYTGNELDVFAGAVYWKTYFSKIFRPYISGKILEAGAGIGSNTAYFLNDQVESLLCLEPDAALGKHISTKIHTKQLPECVSYVNGTTSNLNGNGLFDTILYIDVLEHIENDRAEISRAYNLLKPGGNLIILVPAYNMLYTDLDKEIGHFRRYTRKTLRKAIVPGFSCKKLNYLDSIGFFASLANKLLFKNASASHGAIRFWDKVMVPISRISDPLCFHSFGKSLIGIWQKSPVT